MRRFKLVNMATKDSGMGTSRRLSALKQGCQECQACPLYKHATQAVVGEGPARARLALVGEQPGDEEDRAGRPFVGPSGRLMNTVLEDLELARPKLFVTNAVKHFKFVERGKRRLHEKPRASEVKACRPWLEQELGIVAPAVVVALGATATAALLGPAVRLTVSRGQLLPATLGAVSFTVVPTYHPSALLRAPTPEARREQRRLFAHDLAIAAKAAASG